jgi:hypothetical protein
VAGNLAGSDAESGRSGAVELATAGE